MFDIEAWRNTAFNFSDNGHDYSKDADDLDYVINNAMWEFDASDTAIPNLLMIVLADAPGLAEGN